MSPENTRDVTLGEVSRQVADMRDSVDRLAEAVHSSSEKHAADFVRMGHLEARIVALEDWQKWAQRLVLGAVISAVVAFVLLDPLNL